MLLVSPSSSSSMTNATVQLQLLSWMPLLPVVLVLIVEEGNFKNEHTPSNDMAASTSSFCPF
jgi:hypothetical protein